MLVVVFLRVWEDGLRSDGLLKMAFRRIFQMGLAMVQDGSLRSLITRMIDELCISANDEIVETFTLLLPPSVIDARSHPHAIEVHIFVLKVIMRLSLKRWLADSKTVLALFCFREGFSYLLLDLQGL